MPTSGKRSRRLAVRGVLPLVAALSGSPATASPCLTYLSQTDFPTGYSYQGAEVGGLSGVDYDPGTKRFIAISDHGPSGAPTRLYTLVPTFAEGHAGFGLTFIQAADLGPDNVESIRYDPRRDGFWFTTEGTPTIVHRTGGGETKTLAVPANILTRGRANNSLEGSTFKPDGALLVSMENALRSDADDLTRITRFAKDGTPAAQFAYRLDSKPGNGTSEILAMDDHRLLVLERAFDGVPATTPPTGVSHNSIRIYSVRLDGAADVRGSSNLFDPKLALAKTLVFDSAELARTLGSYETKIDNLEGMTFGPTLANGHLSLVLVSDNNYSRTQGKTQFVVFDVDPRLSREQQAGAGDACAPDAR